MQICEKDIRDRYCGQHCAWKRDVGGLGSIKIVDVDHNECRKRESLVISDASFMEVEPAIGLTGLCRSSCHISLSHFQRDVCAVW